MTHAANIAPTRPIEIAIIGGGMFTADVVLPVAYHLQRTGVANGVRVCAASTARLTPLAEDAAIQQAFPGQTFEASPPLDTAPEERYPELYKDVIAALPKHSAVLVVLPDEMHYDVVMYALEHDQHVLCVKPLTHNYAQAKQIEAVARERGLFVGVEYHKRFDRRSLMAKRHYGLGNFGQFVAGEAKMIEPYFYRSSNFQNWFTCDATDPFVYVGCHYVDLVCFITGLKPVAVSVSGVKGKFPNGREGYMWANGRVIFDNGAFLSVTDGLGYPDDGAGSNEQCLNMFFEGEGKSGHLKHDDQFRGVSYSYLEGIGCGGTRFNYVSPDFFQYIPWEGAGFKPAGYGVESVAGIVEAMCRVNAVAADLPEQDALLRRRELIAEIDAQGLIATPANSSYNELVVEAARLSILHNGHFADIEYGEKPAVRLR